MMQRSRIKRCQVPIRTRRRQSDAKWRASVASCYETLKFIIPNGKALPKRKTSKSLILQETEKHIGALERAVTRLLNFEAQDQGQGVLWRKGDSWAPATLDDLQNDFIRQQGDIFHQSSQGRRCYNMLHDIHEEILNLSMDSRNLAFLPLRVGEEDEAARDMITCTSRRHRVSKARCRYETERACHKILAAYNTGDIVNAVIPSSISTYNPEQVQGVPTFPVAAGASSSGPTGSRSVPGTTITLQKLGNIFLSMQQGKIMTDLKIEGDQLHFQGMSGLERMMSQPQENEQLQKVPILMSPNKLYGISRHDVMLPQECEVPDILNPLVPQLTTPTTNPILVKTEPDCEEVIASPSNICKKLDFNISTPELFETSVRVTDSSPCFSAVVTSASTVFSPLKSEIHSIGFTPFKSVLRGGSSLTPVKISSEPYMSDAALFSPSSVWPLGSVVDTRVPQTGLNDFEILDDDHNLLCMENFDLDDITDPPFPDKTPQKLTNPTAKRHVCKKRTSCRRKCHAKQKDRKHISMSNRPKPACRKRLEGLYEKSAEKSSEAAEVPVVSGILDSNTEWSDFDGYLLYYQQVAPGLKKQFGTSHDANSLAAIVSSMWSQLPSDDRNTMVTLAVLENQDSNSSGSGSLSQDLEELNVTPIADRELGY